MERMINGECPLETGMAKIIADGLTDIQLQRLKAIKNPKAVNVYTLKATTIDNVSGDRIDQEWEFASLEEAEHNLELLLTEQKEHETIKYIIRTNGYMHKGSSPANW